MSNLEAYKNSKWEKGISGNPNGRPSKEQTLTRILKDYLEKIDSKTQTSYKQRLVEKIVELALKGDISAIKLILNYIDGMPKQQIDIQDEDNLKSVEVVFVDSKDKIDELKRLEERLEGK